MYQDFLQLGQSTMQLGLDRALFGPGDLGDLGHRFVFEVPQNDHHAVLEAQFLQRVLQQAILLALPALVGGWGSVFVLY
jgi:hypothetical protein